MSLLSSSCATRVNYLFNSKMFRKKYILCFLFTHSKNTNSEREVREEKGQTKEGRLKATSNEFEYDVTRSRKLKNAPHTYA